MKRNCFFWFRETEAKRSETVSVSLSLASKQNFFKAKLGHPSFNTTGGRWEAGGGGLEAGVVVRGNKGDPPTS